jgi:hypothetical protein
MVRTLAMWFGALAVALAMTSGAAGQKKRGGPKVITLEEIKIEGRVQKPNAFYILNRSNIGYEVMELRTSFIHKVFESVQKSPF